MYYSYFDDFLKLAYLFCKYFLNWLQRWYYYWRLTLVFFLASEFQREWSFFSLLSVKANVEKKNEIGLYSRSLITSLKTGLALANLAIKTKSLFMFYFFIFYLLTLHLFLLPSHPPPLATNNLFSVFMYLFFVCLFCLSYSTYKRDCMVFVIYLSLTCFT